MVRNGEDDDAIALRAIEERKRETLEDDAASVCNGRRTGQWKSDSPGGCFLDSGSKAGTEAGLRLVVENDLGKKLLACLCDKTCPFHRARRLASANTSSAE